jgi:hypothetical protein
MTDANRLLTALRNELVTAGLVRRPSVVGAAPAMHIEPRDGPPAPGEREAPETDGNLVVTLRLSGSLGEGAFGSYRRRVVVDLLYRSTGTDGLRAGRALDAAIVDRVVRRADYGAGYTLDAGGASPTLVLQSSVYAGLGPLSEIAGTRTDIAKILLEVLAA